MQLIARNDSFVRRRVLVVGDAVVPTGFARVIHSILDRLHARYEFHQLGINYRGDPHERPWKIYPAGLDGDVSGLNRLAPLIERVRPDLVLLVGDLWMVMQQAGEIERFRETVRSIAYFPVESDPVEQQGLVPLLRSIDCLATFTEFGVREVRAACESARGLIPDLPRRRVVAMPLGVDTAVFQPLREIRDAEGLRCNRIAAREALFPERPELRDAFIVLNANRNQPRKRIDITMEAFALFARDKPADVKLYLHMGREDCGWDIQLLAQRLNIAHRLLVTKNDNNVRDESSELLNFIYNACDVGVNTACAEGWGLVSFEHAATGAAQVVPRHTSLVELWEQGAELVPPRFRLTTERILTNAYYVDANDVASAFERLYADPSHRWNLSRAALQTARRTQYGWDALAECWHELFCALLPHSLAASKADAR